MIRSSHGALVLAALLAAPGAAAGGGAAWRPDARAGRNQKRCRLARQRVMAARALEAAAETAEDPSRLVEKARAHRLDGRLQLLRVLESDARAHGAPAASIAQLARQVEQAHRSRRAASRAAADDDAPADPALGILYHHIGQVWQQKPTSGRKTARHDLGQGLGLEGSKKAPALGGSRAQRRLQEARAKRYDPDNVRRTPVDSNTMHRSRSLELYRDGYRRFEGLALPDLESALRSLGPRQTWLDVGIGEGRAVDDYLTADGPGWPARKARVIGVDLVADGGKALVERHGPRAFQFHQGDVIDAPIRRQVDLITDIFGAFSYGDHPDAVIDRYGALLRGGGLLVVRAGGLHDSVIYGRGREPFDLVDWLDAADGFEIVTVRRNLDSEVAVVLRRTEGPARAPRLSVASAEGHQGIPQRVFWTDAPLAHDR